MNVQQIVAGIIDSIIDAVFPKEEQYIGANTPIKLNPFASEDEELINRYHGGLSGSYMKIKLHSYEKEAYASFQSEKLNLVTHVSALEKYIQSNKKQKVQTEDPKPKDSTVKPVEDSTFMQSAKIHVSRIMEEKEHFENAKKLIMNDGGIKRKHSELENSSPNVANMEILSKIAGADKIEPIPEVSVRLEEDYNNKRIKYVPPKHPKKINVSAIKSKIDTNLNASTVLK
jgi:hypothetical protein